MGVRCDWYVVAENAAVQCFRRTAGGSYYPSRSASPGNPISKRGRSDPSSRWRVVAHERELKSRFQVLGISLLHKSMRPLGQKEREGRTDEQRHSDQCHASIQAACLRVNKSHSIGSSKSTQVSNRSN